MARIDNLFVTQLYREELGGAQHRRLLKDLEHSCRVIADDDRAGQAWATANKYPGYTSYASLTDLPDRDPAFGALIEILDSHVAAFARAADFDLGGRKLALNSIWINILNPGGFHGSHLHTLLWSAVRFIWCFRRERDQVRGPAARSDDGSATAQSESASIEPDFRKCRTEAWHAPVMGELVTPRGAIKHRRQRADVNQLQLWVVTSLWCNLLSSRCFFDRLWK